MPQVPQQVDAEYAGAIAQFIQSPEFQQLPPEVQQQAIAFAQQVTQALQQVEQQQQTGHLQFGKAAGNQFAPGGPQQPTAGNTQQVPINPPTQVEASPTNA